MNGLTEHFSLNWPILSPFPFSIKPKKNFSSYITLLKRRFAKTISNLVEERDSSIVYNIYGSLKTKPVNSSPLTPLTFLERATAQGKVFTVYNSTTYTWSETFARCLRLASSISSLIGIKKGQVVSVLALISPPTLELQFAVPMAGAVLNNINTRLDAKTVSVLLQHKDENSVSFSRNLDFRECVTYEAMMVKGNSKFDWVRPKNDWEPMTLNYTSGTTSSPKGVSASVSMDTANVPFTRWKRTWGMAVVGGTNVCLRKFDANIVFHAISKYNVTHMCGAPVVLTMLANSPCGNKLFKKSGQLLRTQPKWNKLAANVKAKLKSRQGIRSLGMTQVDVVDPESGVSVKRDGETMGEIVLRGDVAVMHPDGYLEIKDRTKDIIISGGENVSSVEVESVLYSNIFINEAAVVARPDEFWGRESALERLPHYMIPKTVIFMDELPKTATGKIQKFSLREIANGMGSLPASRM
ncbi:Acyl-CoA synthetase member 3, mitochondrial [Datura stramonium]|uniref:Acyl-CoA synthetase member 3, mitochondrial n=1 Tax=Datura stramonium TaxID=4076 RepID=A0ABS8TPG6_DATST|nr:Acyl-CoA synthetase member 3, mitochondrial [Datura stramonium]